MTVNLTRMFYGGGAKRDIRIRQWYPRHVHSIDRECAHVVAEVEGLSIFV